MNNFIGEDITANLRQVVNLAKLAGQGFIKISDQRSAYVWTDAGRRAISWYGFDADQLTPEKYAGEHMAN